MLLAEDANGLSNAVELAVGVACLVAGGVLLRRPGARSGAIVLVIAGLAATVHGVTAIL